MSYLIVGYNHVGSWDLEELEVDLSTVHQWRIEDDTLHIQRKEDEDWEQFEGNSELDHDYHTSIQNITYEGRDIENGQKV